MRQHLSRVADLDLDDREKKKLIQANYLLGEDSIKTIKSKLMDKMDKN
jgi:hypothetical protein